MAKFRDDLREDGALLSAGRPESIDDTGSDEGAGLASRRADLAPEMDGPGAPTVRPYFDRATSPDDGLLALASWSDVADIVFVRVGTGTDGEEAYSNSATILYSNYATGSPV